MAYTFGMLKTDGSQEAATHNSYWLGKDTLGVEVTQASLAAQCGLGNIDPQHGDNSHSSAIEQALEWPLPPDEASIVTIRLDKDSVGAMAVFMLRNAGLESRIDKCLVSWIGVLDRMPYGQAVVLHQELDEMFRAETTNAMNVIIHRNDHWPTLSEKVLAIAQILVGDMPEKDINEIAWMKNGQAADFMFEMFGPQVAFILAPEQYRQARDWGNRRFPVTVVFDPVRVTDSGGLQEKWTVVRKPNCFDRLGFEIAISAEEAKVRGLTVEEARAQNLAWGGNRNIVSSPQGAGYGTKLSKETILAIVCQHADSGIVS